jgi:hypothetical protein
MSVWNARVAFRLRYFIGKECEGMRRSVWSALALATPIGLISGSAFGADPTATPPYTLSTFATAPKGLSAPDSIAVLGDVVFVGYGDGHAADGSDGLKSQIVEYDMYGNIERIYQVLGHNDGLKVDPSTNLLWALQNEDANPRLVIIDPKTQKQRNFVFGPTPHGGGYDDIVFRDCQVFISASNPSKNPNTGPAIVKARLGNGTVQVTPVLAGNAAAIDIPTDATVQLNLQDPDSMTLDLTGDIVLDSQADQELIVVSDPGGPNQHAYRLPLSFESTTGLQRVQADDTAFATSTQGFVLFADKVLNTVFKLSKEAFAPNAVYTAANGGPFVGTLDTNTGVVTPIVTGLGNPGGVVFVDTSEQDQNHNQNKCNDDQ